MDYKTADGKNRTANQRKFEKQLGAIERAEARQSRSDAEQLAALEARGHGHCGEAISLREKLTGGES